MSVMRLVLWELVVLLGSCMLQPALLEQQSNQQWKEEWLQGLKEYEIVIPRRLKSIGGEPHRRHFLSKRSTSSESSQSVYADSLYYSLAAFNKKLNLQLTPNSDFIAPNLVIERRGQDKNETWIKSSSEKGQHCFHTGIVQDDKESMVSVSLCDSMMGSIFVDNTLYMIQPHPNVTSDTEDMSDIPHIIYKTNHPLINHNSSHCGVQSEYTYPGNRAASISSSPTTKFTKSSNTSSRKKRASTVYQGNDEHFVELMIVADNKMVEFHGSDLEHYLFVLLSIVTSIYKKHTIQNNINIVVVKVVSLDYRQNGPHISTNAATTLHNFCQWQRSQNTEDDSSTNHHDTAVLVTRTDICRSPAKCDTLGLAELGTICDPLRSCAIAEDNGLSAAFTIAHELGHVFSLPHDDDYRCSRYSQGRRDSYSLMAPTLDYTTNPWSWSTCSAAQLTEFLDAGHGKCLQDKPRQSQQYLEKVKSNSEIQPGEQYSIDKQCSQAFGSGSKLCPYTSREDNLCKRLWCTSPGPYGQDNGCRTQHMPWADGTKCGPNMWCLEGRCSQRNTFSPIHGGWSKWQDYGDCSRTCGGGIMKSVRYCNNPSPKHGGRFCVGERVRYESCKTGKCPATDTFRDEQCAKHNGNNFNIISLEPEVKWKPKYSGIAREDRCKLYCQAAGNSAIYYRLEAKVKDGTKCDPYTSDVCVNGKCKSSSSPHYKHSRRKPAGCDNVLGSSKKRDHCGVCDGDGTSCRTVKKLYNPQQQKYGYNAVTVIKKGSSNIHIEQRGYHGRKNDDNYLALRNEAGQFMLNGNYIVSMMKKEIHVKGAVLDYSGSDNVVEVISGTRPINEDIHIMVLAVGKLYPPNITYSYTTSDRSDNSPRTSTPSNRRYTNDPRRYQVKYRWIRRYQQCITKCGEGRKKKVICARMPDKHIVADLYCERHHKQKPRETGCSISHSKDKNQCDTVWRMVSQSACSSRCGQGEGVLKRIHKCFRTWPRTYRKTEIVDEKFCLINDKKPKEKLPCTGLCVEPHWKFGDWSKCTATCDGGLQHRNSKCVDRYDNVIPESQCSSQFRKVTQACNKDLCPTWAQDGWGQCSVTCGQGVKRRHVWCKVNGNPISKTQCNTNSEPESKTECNASPCPKPTWHKDSWKACSVTCGSGVRLRTITCRFQGKVVDNSLCQRKDKPSPIEGCYLDKCPTTTPRTSYRTSHQISTSRTPTRRTESTTRGSTTTSRTTTTSRRPTSRRPTSHRSTTHRSVSNSTPRPVTRWRTGSWTECSVTCGRGNRGRYVSCRDRHGNMAPDSSCSNIPKPPSKEICMEKPCGEWRIGEWSPCPVTCGKGKKSRNVECITLEGLDEQVKSALFCDKSAMPSRETECNTHECLSPRDMDIHNIETNRVERTSHWRTGPWGGCSVTCGGGWRRRAVACMDERGISHDCNPTNQPKDREDCNSNACPIWRNGEWNQCSEKCGGGTQYRMVVCQVPKGSIVENGDCDNVKKPQASRRCNTHDCSTSTPNGATTTGMQTNSPYWYKGPWSTCSLSCGRGGVRTRLVMCMDRNRRRTNERHCQRRSKPKSKRKCRGEACPHWGVGRWGRCSVDCGNGVEKRKVICLAGRRSVADSKKCSHIPKPKDSRPCKANKCGRFVWQASKWSKCSKSCGYGVRYRATRCIDRSRNNSRVHDYYCTSSSKPKRRSRCIHKPCPRQWHPSKWSKCSKRCGEGRQIRNVTCYAISKEGWSYPNPVDGCNPLEKPKTMQQCMLRKCSSNYKWKTSRWRKCKRKCGFGIQKRRVYCIDITTREKVSPRKCDRMYKPDKKKSCYVRPCFASSCDELKRQTGTKEDGEYRMLIQGSIVNIYCHHMSKSHPHEYITLSTGNVNNYATIFHQRLKDETKCPLEPHTCEDCFVENLYSRAGQTYFSKVRINITSLQVKTDNYLFTTSRTGFKQVAFGEAGDCYSANFCPQGQFKIDLTDTGFRLSNSTQWQSKGHNPAMNVVISENNTKVEGSCGGYCGSCHPINGIIQLEVVPQITDNQLNLTSTETFSEDEEDDDYESEMSNEFEDHLYTDENYDKTIETGEHFYTDENHRTVDSEENISSNIDTYENEIGEKNYVDMYNEMDTQLSENSNRHQDYYEDDLYAERKDFEHVDVYSDKETHQNTNDVTEISDNGNIESFERDNDKEVNSNNDGAENLVERNYHEWLTSTSYYQQPVDIEYDTNLDENIVDHNYETQIHYNLYDGERGKTTIKPG